MDMASILKPKIIEALRKLGIEEMYTITKTLAVDVDGDVDLEASTIQQNFGGLKKLPVVFNKVSGSFNASELGLESVHGMPREVGNHFDISHNNFTSLQGLHLKFTKGGRNTFDVSECHQLKSIACSVQFAADNVFFMCNNCESLTTLEGGPTGKNNTFVHYDVEGCDLRTTKGMENLIIGHLTIRDNQNLKAFDFPPKELYGLVSLSGTDIPLEEVRKLKVRYPKARITSGAT